MMISFVSSIGFAAESAGKYIEGRDYKVLKTPGIPSTFGKIEVREFFWYGCPHCFKLEQSISPWKRGLAKDVDFVMTPAVAAPHWKVLGAAYYAAKNLGLSDKAHSDIFNHIHKHRHSLNTPGQVAKFYSQYGVSKDEFLKEMESFSVKTAMRKSTSLFRQYQLSAVPAIVVNGKYQPMAKTYQEMLKVVDFLVEKERKAMMGK